MLSCLLFNDKTGLWFEMVWGSCDKADDDSELLKDYRGVSYSFSFLRDWECPFENVWETQ